VLRQKPIGSMSARRRRQLARDHAAELVPDNQRFFYLQSRQQLVVAENQIPKAVEPIDVVVPLGRGLSPRPVAARVRFVSRRSGAEHHGLCARASGNDGVPATRALKQDLTPFDLCRSTAREDCLITSREKLQFS